ncbi:MAG: hypothetical protein KTV77_05360 [Wolbachia endosymbiont of Fragariocoptes setiger]|nr:hypothetical protein [Wolbachia endosymbiont of Fragariocoptes setiger]
MQKPIITPENIKPFTEDLTNNLIKRGENTLNFNEVLEDFASCNVTFNVPETISLKQEKLLAEINRYFTNNIKRFLPNYERSIPGFNEYEMIIYSLSERIRTRLEEEYQPRTSYTYVSIVNLAKSRSL